MEKVTGIGGFFFRSENPEALRTWYHDHLGVDMAPQFSGGAPWKQDEGFTVFDPFSKADTMIPPGKTWMINFRVADLAKMIEQLRGAGIAVADLEDYPHGKFTTLEDPEGNGIQLWQPPIQ
ncbi:MAG: VOC family protein [Pseudomonadota bacterium]